MVPSRRRPEVARAVPRDVRAHLRRHAGEGRDRARRIRVRPGPRGRRRGLRRGPHGARAVHRATGSRSTRRSRRCSRGSRDGTRQAALDGHTITVKLLVTAMRQAARSVEVAACAVRWRDAGVVGFDIAGPEAGYRPTRHLDAFDLVRRENFHITIHAGESFGLPSIWEALQFCGAERLGHGVRIVDDITVHDDGSVRARPAGGVRPRPPGAARDVPDLERPHRAARLDRRAPLRPPPAAPVPGHRQHRQPADERRLRSRPSSPPSTRRSTSAWARWSG